MTIEHFLTIWNQHNTVIIEGLVGLIILLSLFLGYRSFFGNKSVGGEHGAVSSLDTAQLEKTLQKILDAQGAAAKHSGTPHVEVTKDSDVAGVSEVTALADSVGAAASADVEKLRSVVSENQKTIEVLKSQLAEAKAQAGAPAAVADSGMSDAEKEDLRAKIRELESRLAEYEIISEDIADLSRYKDENESLRAELEALQKATAAAPAVAVTPVAVAPAPQPVPAPAPTEQAPADAAGADLIDDELMKEFAAAVEGQKSISEKAGSGDTAPEKKTDDSEQLMGEFENFVAKKS